MISITVSEREAGQRLDKLLRRYLNLASDGFLYKMLRKKNITLNEKKATGREPVAAGDCVKLFFSEETLAKFSTVLPGGDPHPESAKRPDRSLYRNHQERLEHRQCPDRSELIPPPDRRKHQNQTEHGGHQSQSERRNRLVRSERCQNQERLERGKRPEQSEQKERRSLSDHGNRNFSYPPLQESRILYADEDVILINKPVGALSQKALPTDCSINESLISWLLQSGRMTEEELKIFRPGVCNRLDRNTSGILLAGVSVRGAAFLSALLKNRTLHKYYQCLVKGKLEEPARLEGYLSRDPEKNQVSLFPEEHPGTVKIITEYRPIGYYGDAADATLLEVLLVTGRTHQIRAHLASIGHPIIGDRKYGDPALNRVYAEQYGLTGQFLHAGRVEFPLIEGDFARFSGQSFTAPLPSRFRRILHSLKTADS